MLCVYQLTGMLNMQDIRIAQRIPSRQNEATEGSSLSCRLTLNAARNGLHATLNTQNKMVNNGDWGRL